MAHSQRYVMCSTYVFDVSHLQVSERLLSALSPERRAKVCAFKHDKGRRQSLGAGLLLDYVLRRHGCCGAQIAVGPHGKPYLAASDGLHFNLSHSGEMVACAIASSPVGVDIECSSRRVSDALLKRVCCEAEQRLVVADTKAFFDCWTRKEAVVKMTGVGIACDLASLDTTAATTWRLSSGYVLSVCTQDVNETKKRPVVVSLEEKSLTFVLNTDINIQP